MKKAFYILLILFLSANVYAGVPEEYKFVGTYLPESYIQRISENKTHIASMMNDRKKNDYYDVISISYDEGKIVIFSNYRFHDGAQLPEQEFKHNWKLSDNRIITDLKGNRYIRISENPQYYPALFKYLSSILFNKNEYSDNDSTFKIGDLGNIFYNNKTYRIHLDYFFRQREMDEIYSNDGGETESIAFQIKDSKLYLYKLSNIEYDSADKELMAILE